MFVSESLGVNEKGHLVFGGHDTVDLAGKYGTPVYIMDGVLIRKNCRKFVNSINENYDGNGRVIYASKAFSCKAMYKIIGELESLGDSGETISRILSRKNIHKKGFNAETLKNLNAMADAVCQTYDVMIENLVAAHKGELTEISNAYNAEDRLNTLRNNFRDSIIENIDNDGKNYQTNVYFMDIVNTYEHMGDYMINVSQDLKRAFVKK